MDYLRDVLKRLDFVLVMIIFIIGVFLFTEILHLFFPNYGFKALSNHYLPDHYMYVYIGALVLFVLRYVLTGRTTINPDKLE